nr:hypothetical protein [Tanacetum cinerariifolium]
MIGDDEYKGRMPTKIELTLEQSQQGVSNDVLVSIKGVEELKRNVWIKGENKEALQTLLSRNQRRTPMPAEASGPAESPSLDAELALIDSETESDDKVPKINTGDQDEDQAGPNLGIQDEEAIDASHLQNPKQLDEEFTTTAYPNVRENLKLTSEDPVIPKEPSSSTGTLSSLSPLLTSSATTSTVMTTTTIPPPPQPQQSTAYLTLMKRINELEQHMENLLQYNLGLEESDLPTVDMKEILQQWMFESNSYEAHEDHKKLYDAVEKSLELDYSDQYLSDLDEARNKKRKRRDVPRTPSGSPPPQPPPPPPPAGAYGAPDVINLQFQMEECHKLLIDQVDWMNPEGDQVRIDVNRPSPLDGSLDMILHRVEKKSDHTCGFLVSLELKPTQDTGHLDYFPGSNKKMLSTAVKLWTQNLVIRQRVEDFQLVMFPVNNNEREIMRFNKIYKFSDGTLTQILEALAYRVKEFKIKQLNSGMNMRFWTHKDVIRSKEFITAIERRLKTRMIYQNLECFVGGRVRDIDYRCNTPKRGHSGI